MSAARASTALLAWLAVAACDGGMEDQGPYSRADEPGPALFDPIPPGTVPRGMIEYRAAAAEPPVRPSPRRGGERYAIFCTPCHGPAGDGDGVVVRNGFPPPPSFHDPARRDLRLAGIVDVVTNGKGRMYPFAGRIAPADRWHIAAYVKALQLSRAVPVDRLPPEDRGRLP
ncbi:MAG TPA: cytochrome c [Arenibaculum sp.]|nr:cytochrome c [Arenibaculum sp.]